MVRCWCASVLAGGEGHERRYHCKRGGALETISRHVRAAQRARAKRRRQKQVSRAVARASCRLQDQRYALGDPGACCSRFRHAAAADGKRERGREGERKVGSDLDCRERRRLLFRPSTHEEPLPTNAVRPRGPANRTGTCKSMMHISGPVSVSWRKKKASS